MKYGIWNVAAPSAAAVNALTAQYAPLTAMVLSARGIQSLQQAQALLRCDTPLPDPFLMLDMAKAAARVGLAMTRGEKIAVFGDYDVDGITATCLLTDFLRRHGADCICYIPGRLEEGYGLNPGAIRLLHDQGVQLIITVDCGITAVAEAALCRELGMDLVITDHHECKPQLPDAAAVVDPHRPGDGYPHRGLSGVGISFKLASALSGDQAQILEQYADLVCLGTVADVMPLQGENRVLVAQGLERLRHTHRPGIAALMHECGCNPESLSANTIGFTLAPRINAAGRMGEIELATRLFLTEDPVEAAQTARALCELNRRRQEIEAGIYEQAVRMLDAAQPPQAIVLASEAWHQGVVGIVASRIAEAYCCPTFLICLDGEHGKASSRSYGGFNLFTSLASLSDLLESYGGHELAAGFTIHRDRIDEFRQCVCAQAEQFYADTTPRTTLDIDCVVTPELLTVPNVAALDALEPCGNGCPKPVLMLGGLSIERIIPVCGGRHMRLRLRQGRWTLGAIFFCCDARTASISQGDLVDVAFVPQINDYRGEQSVQLNVLDIRPSCTAACSAEAENYRALRRGSLSRDAAAALLPSRTMLAAVWRYLSNGSCIEEEPVCLCRKIVRWSGLPLSLEQMLTCLDIFSDVGLLHLQRRSRSLLIRPSATAEKADLNQSQTMQRLLKAKES